jgi:hypothetical protein
VATEHGHALPPGIDHLLTPIEGHITAVVISQGGEGRCVVGADTGYEEPGCEPCTGTPALSSPACGNSASTPSPAPLDQCEGLKRPVRENWKRLLPAATANHLSRRYPCAHSS